MEAIIKEILDLEWAMMGRMEGTENNEEERPVFEAMRRAQFAAWPEEVAASYLRDLKAAEAEGRNLQSEKFMRMLKNIAPEEYAKQLSSLPGITAEKAEAVAGIWEMLKKQNQDFAEKYAVLGLSGRPLSADSETDIPSIETYQCSEMLTYSMETLKLFHDFVAAEMAAGRNLVEQIQKNTVASMGFQSLEEAETQIAMAALAEMGGESCSSCGCGPEC